MDNPWQNITYKFKTGNKLYLLIGVNVIVFLIALIFTSLDGYLRLPAYLPALQRHFWTPLTYMFLHDGIISVIFNMLWLYWMGQIFEEFLGYNRILGVYLLGGVAGAALFILGCNVIPLVTHNNFLQLNYIAGATASVLTIIVATATLLPNQTILLFIWPVKLKWLVLIYAIIDLINISGTGGGVIIAHIGGALFGFLYIKQLKKGNDWIGIIANLFKRGSKLKVASNNLSKRSSSRPRQDEVDQILDKISKSGYVSLSKEEKGILFRASKNES
jgi:membrane associated rhomboid family serine protease